MPQPEIWFEDLVPGSVRTFGRHEVDRDEMVAFARAFDPQPFHLDEAAAASSPPGRLIASGWYSCALLMRLFCRDRLLRSSSLGGPGVEEVRWLRAVVPGDVLALRQTIREARLSQSRPGMGLVRFESDLVAEDGRPVLHMLHLVMFATRAGADGAGVSAAPARPPGESFSPPQPEDPAAAPRWFEEVEPGRRVDLGTYAFSRERCLAFARSYDMQGFHVDDAAAAASPFGRLAASGWHTGAAWMSRFANHLSRTAEEGDRAGGRPQIGVSPGFRDLNWLRPVFAGDVIRYTTEPASKRPLASRPCWGLVTSRNAGWNEAGEQVFGFTGNVLWRLRGG